MIKVLRIALPPPTFFLRYPLITYFSYVASYSGASLRVVDEYIELVSSSQKLKDGIEALLSDLTKGRVGGLKPYVPQQEARNRLRSLIDAGICSDADVASLIKCYLDKVVTRLNADEYFNELSRSISTFSNGYINDSTYGLFSPLSILLPESMEALRVFGATWSRGTQIYPRHALLRERMRIGFHSLVAGLAGLWLGKLYEDPTTEVSTYILLTGEKYVKQAIDGHREVVTYGKAKQLSDIALRIVSAFKIYMHGERATLVEIIEGGNRCDLIRFDIMEVKELVEFAKLLDEDTRNKILKAIIIGDEYSNEIAYRLFVAATNPRLRYESFYSLARKLLYSENTVLKSKDLSIICKALEALHT